MNGPYSLLAWIHEDEVPYYGKTINDLRFQVYKTTAATHKIWISSLYKDKGIIIHPKVAELILDLCSQLEDKEDLIRLMSDER